MYDVGGNQGIAHRQQQGTGNATILQGSNLPAAQTYAQVMFARRKKEEDDAKVKRDAALAQFSKINPDFWSKHNDEKRAAMEALREKFITASKGGTVDPFVASDPDSRALQDEYQKLQRMSQASMDRKAAFEATRGQLNGKDPGEFTNASLSRMYSYLDEPLAASLDQEVVPPMLEAKKPVVNRQNIINALMTDIDAKRKGIPLSDKERVELVKDRLVDPSSAALIDNYNQSFAQMPKPDMDALKSRASNMGRSIVEQAMYEDTVRWEERRAPLDMEKLIRDAAQAIKVDAYSVNNAGTGSSGATNADRNHAYAKRKAMAKNLFDKDPRIITFYDDNGQLPRDQSETDAEYRLRVEEHMAKAMIPMIDMPMSTKTTAADDKEKGDAKISGDKWLADLKSGNENVAPEALNYLKDYKMQSGMVIESATYQTHYMVNGEPTARLKLKSPVQVDELKKAVEGEFGKQVSDEVTYVEKGVQDEVVIPLSKITPNDNFWLSIYYGQRKSKGINYEGAKFQPKTVEDLMKPQNIQQGGAATGKKWSPSFIKK